MDAIVIHLERAKERAQLLIPSLRLMGFHVTLVPALDALTIENDCDEFARYRKAAKVRYGRDVRPSEFACLKSHIRANVFALKNRLQRYVILEDDAIIAAPAPCVIEDEGPALLKFYGGMEGLGVATLRMWRATAAPLSFECDDFRYLQRASSYALSQEATEWYVANMVNMGIINDDWGALAGLGVVRRCVLRRCFAHPVANQSFISERSNHGSTRMLFRIKALAYNAINRERVSYNGITGA